MIKKKLLISGKVQGVSFRYHAHEMATKLGLRGWVRNLDDGRVEIVIAGTQKASDTMVQWCHVGPTQAKVENIELTEFKSEIPHEEFIIRRDGGK